MNRGQAYEGDVIQGDLFHVDVEEPEKPAGDQVRRLRVLITVKAAPNPSATYGETVCIAGVSAEVERPGWLRLYPVNFRHLENDTRFRKYNIVSVDARPARNDQRTESWRPQVESLEVHEFLPPWTRRKLWLDSYISESMCGIQRAVNGRPSAQSLALVEARDISDLIFECHPGWTKDEQRKIDRYSEQIGLFGGPTPEPLEAPRFRGHYKWRCSDRTCRGHRQGVLDWEFVALQRRCSHRDDENLKKVIREKFLDIPTSKRRSLCFYVGNQAKRTNVFSVLGLYYPD